MLDVHVDFVAATAATATKLFERKTMLQPWCGEYLIPLYNTMLFTYTTRIYNMCVCLRIFACEVYFFNIHVAKLALRRLNALWQ